MNIISQLDPVTRRWARGVKHPARVKVELNPFIFARLDRNHFKQDREVRRSSRN
jgi:hypothetical protein